MTIDRGETVFAETGIRAKLYVGIVGIFMGKRLCPPNKAASRVCVRAATLRTGIVGISLIERGKVYRAFVTEVNFLSKINRGVYRVSLKSAVYNRLGGGSTRASKSKRKNKFV